MSNAINWFPGHMFKAHKEMIASMPSISLIIEVLDARIPFSSENPLIEKIRDGKPCIKVLNKSDLADEKKTIEWVKHFEKDENVKALPLNSKDKKHVNRLRTLVESHLPDAVKIAPTAMIIGIPNVGKSTLINTLAGRVVCKTGNVPAVTKGQQFIKISQRLHLLDTPGILWPKLDPVECGYRLAITGAIKDAAFDYSTIGDFALQYMIEKYRSVLEDVYRIPPDTDNSEEVLKAVAKRRGCFLKGGHLNLLKAEELLVHDIRKGSLGRVTLETPDMISDQIIQDTKLQGIRGKARRIELKKLKKNANRETIRSEPE